MNQQPVKHIANLGGSTRILVMGSDYRRLRLRMEHMGQITGPLFAKLPALDSTSCSRLLQFLASSRF